MKLICDGIELSDAVMKVIKATAQKTTNPILEGIKLKAFEDKLILSATDLELSIEKIIKADVKIDGEVVVPGKFFADFIKKLASEQIELSLTDNKLLKVSYTDSETYVQCLSEEEFPIIKNIETQEKFTITSKSFKDLINKTTFSCAIDDSRPILKGCLFEIYNKKLTAIALDGFRLAKVEKTLKESNFDYNCIIPARSLIEIGRLIEDTDDEIVVYVQKNYVMMEYDNTKVITRLLDGDFINYNQIIPSNASTVITVNKKQLEEALDRASILSRMDKNNLVKFDIKGNLLCLTSNSDIGNIKENLTINLNGKDIIIAFNSRYLSECFRVIDDEFVNINFCSSITPCTITSSKNSEYLYLILPVRVMV